MIINITKKGKFQSSRVTCQNGIVKIDDFDVQITMPENELEMFLENIRKVCERNNEFFEVIGTL